MLSQHYTRVSLIEAHPKDPFVDELYKPLRDTFLLDTTAKKTFLDDVSHLSHVSHDAAPHTYQQNHKLGLQTIILEDAHLYPINDMSLISNRNFKVVNAKEKVMEPIDREQLEKRLKNAQKQQIIIYTYGPEGSPEKTPQKKPMSLPKPKSLSKPKSGIKVTQPKYNLFSIFDEAFNSKSCTCPANELIASQRSEANWSEIKKLQEEGFL